MTFEKLNLKEFKKKYRAPRPLSDLFISIIQAHAPLLKIGMEAEVMFYPGRRWRFDFAWANQKLAVECDGMAWQAGGGRHNTDGDREKMNAACTLGWRVLHFSGAMLKNDPLYCVRTVAKALQYSN